MTAPQSGRAALQVLGLLVIALAAFSAVGSGQPAPQGRAPYDLASDEKLGGHTLARHVGKTDQELAARLRQEPHISAASTYTDAGTAGAVVAQAIARSKGRVDAWLARTGSRPNLVLNVTMTTGPPIGRSLRRGDREARPCSRAVVVMRWDDRRRRAYVLTSYPETTR